MEMIRWALFAMMMTITPATGGKAKMPTVAKTSTRIKVAQAVASPITSYRKTSKTPCLYKDELHVMLRLFKRDGKEYAVIVNVHDLKVKVVEQSLCSYRENDQEGRYFSSDELVSSLYYRLLSRFNVVKNVKNNQGLRSVPEVQGAFLSIDMCPSSKKMEYSLFEAISNVSNKHNSPNLLIAVSGLWIVAHPEDFAWLRSFVNKNNIKVTWVNHSFSHVYYKGVKPEENFLLLPNTDMETEILETEKQLIKYGEPPSVFFRCPGLISNKTIADTLTSYGLIQLGASTWIAKLPANHKVENGDIVLVHGNGNESRRALKSVIQLIRSDRIPWEDLQKALKFAYAKRQA